MSSAVTCEYSMCSLRISLTMSIVKIAKKAQKTTIESNAPVHVE